MVPHANAMPTEILSEDTLSLLWDRRDTPTMDVLRTWSEFAALTLDMPMVCLLVSSEVEGGTVQVFHGAGNEAPIDSPPLPAALSSQGFCVVSDARADNHLRVHPWVTGHLGVIFIAAVTLRLPSSQAIGTVCVMDSAPRHFNDREARLLTSFAQLLASDWMLRKQAFMRVAEHQALEQSHGWLLESVSQDPLTQLANRLALMGFLEKTLSLAHRESQPLAVLLFDIVDFKSINAEFGEALGDHVLVEVASRLAACARGSELVGRMSGNEFMAVLFPCTHEQSQMAVERFTTAVERRPVLLSAGLKVSVSVATGVFSTIPARDLTPDELYRCTAKLLDDVKKTPNQTV